MSEIKLQKIKVCLDLPMELIEALENAGKVSGKPQEELIAHYLTKGIAHDMPKLKKKLFLDFTREALKDHDVSDEVLEEIATKFDY
jgi:hypothetical protein